MSALETLRVEVLYKSTTFTFTFKSLGIAVQISHNYLLSSFRSASRINIHILHVFTDKLWVKMAVSVSYFISIT